MDELLLQDDLADKEVVIAVHKNKGPEHEQDPYMTDKGGGHVSPDIRQRFAPLEGIIPE